MRRSGQTLGKWLQHFRGSFYWIRGPARYRGYSEPVLVLGKEFTGFAGPLKGPKMVFLILDIFVPLGRTDYD